MMSSQMGTLYASSNIAWRLRGVVVTRYSRSITSDGKPLPIRTQAPTMGNSVSPGLGNSANHGLRDVGSAEPCRGVERPAEHLEEANRKSQIQLPVPPKSYTATSRDSPNVGWNV